jgi:hypothetical protein
MNANVLARLRPSRARGTLEQKEVKNEGEFDCDC